MEIYHGGFCVIEKPKILQSHNNKDFGQGFYCTQMQAQAERWARRFDTPFVSVFAYTQKPGLKELHFDEMTDKWLDFIADCRNGKTHDYDIVAGAMANDQVWNYVADFIAGILTREQFWALARFKHPTHQIAFCNARALDALHFSKAYGVKL
jgi:hypothetical protein